jgi:hypothetical protein
VAKVTTTTLTSGAHIGCSSTHWDDTYFNDRRRHSITPYPTAERAEAQQTIARNIEPEAASAPTAVVPWSELTDSVVDSSLASSPGLVGGSV